jgi:hypothetical protein
MGVYSLTIRLVIQPFTFIFITICMKQGSSTGCFIFFPFSDIERTVTPFLLSFPISHSIEPLTIIISIFFHFNNTQVDWSCFIKTGLYSL